MIKTEKITDRNSLFKLRFSRCHRRGIFNSLLEVYLTLGKKNVTSGHRIRRFGSHCFKTPVYTVPG